MRVSNLNFEQADVEIDLGYRAQMRVTLKFTDQNNIAHRRDFEILVYGEKPTCLIIRNTKQHNIIYSTTSDLDFL